MSILIRNLPKAYSESELRALFEPFGTVASCDLVMDPVSGLSKGFGFVEMEDSDATDNAISSLNSTLVKEQKIRVKWSNQEKKMNPDGYQPQQDHEHSPGEASVKDYKDVWNNAKKRISAEDENEQ